MRADVKIGVITGLIMLVCMVSYYSSRETDAPVAVLRGQLPFDEDDYESKSRVRTPTPAVSSPTPRAMKLAKAPTSPTPVPKATPLTRTPSPKPTPAVKIHVVREGDTLSEIAKLHYESSALAQVIIDANPQIKDPNRLSIGQRLVIPVDAPPTRRESSSKSEIGESDQNTEFYIVQPGETFRGIAKKSYGDVNQWEKLFDANKKTVGGDKKGLRPGMRIRIPR
jgi:nucleoid-associated protein YgaU